MEKFKSNYYMSFKIWEALVVYHHIKAYDNLRSIRKTIRIMKSFLLSYLGGFSQMSGLRKEDSSSLSHILHSLAYWEVPGDFCF